MRIKKARTKINSFLVPFLYTSSILIGVTSFSPNASANEWAMSERRGTCLIPNRQTNFECKFPRSRQGYPNGQDTYNVVNGAREISGFYVNPWHQIGDRRTGASGTIPMQYRMNGGAWINRNLNLNSTNSNYISLPSGVRSLEFQILRPTRDELGAGSTIVFTTNYDLRR